MTVYEQLSPYEQWMVNSNMRTVQSSEVTVADQADRLRRNGYPRVAEALEEVAASVPCQAVGFAWRRLKNYRFRGDNREFGLEFGLPLAERLAEVVEGIAHLEIPGDPMIELNNVLSEMLSEKGEGDGDS